MNEFLGHGLAQRMSELAVRLRDEDSRDGTLRAIVHAALDLVPGTRWAGISLIRGNRVTVEAASDSLVFELDQYQSNVGEGPCLSAIHHQHTVHAADLAEPGQPWPRFAAAATERGVRGMMSQRLFVRRETLGVLNLYTDQPDAFTPDAQILAELVAQHAAVAVAGAIREHDLNAALVNRDVLGQAKGILMQRDRLTTPQAFQLLVRTSQETNTKIAEVARRLITDIENNARGLRSVGASSPFSRPRPARPSSAGQGEGTLADSS